ncbi:MAG: MarR family transcriptional regulator [Elusimicrobiota bacterium]
MEKDKNNAMKDFMELQPKLARLFKLKIPKEMIKVNLSAVHIHILCAVMKEPLKMSDLAEYVSVSYAMMTHLVDQLENYGFVQRSPGVKDRRVIRIKITGKGKVFLDKMKHVHVENMNKILNRLSARDKKELLGHIAGLSKILSKYQER